MVILRPPHSISSLSTTFLFPHLPYCITSKTISCHLRLSCISISVPEGVQPPDVSNRITGQVLVTWEEPTHPNGIILFYLVERRQNSNEEYTQLHNQTTSLLLLFADSTVEPFTEYSYRIVAVNSAGSTTGAPNTILTPEAGEWVVSLTHCALLLCLVPLIQPQKVCLLQCSPLSHLRLFKSPFNRH